MSNDLSVARIGRAAAIGEVARPPSGTPSGTPGGTSADRRASDRATAPPAPAGKSLPNPTLRLDPGLAIVVIEFRDESGAVRSTIPTEQQLDAYRSWERGNIGEPRPGRRETAPDAASSRAAGESAPASAPIAATPALPPGADAPAVPSGADAPVAAGPRTPAAG